TLWISATCLLSLTLQCKKTALNPSLNEGRAAPSERLVQPPAPKGRRVVRRNTSHRPSGSKGARDSRGRALRPRRRSAGYPSEQRHAAAAHNADGCAEWPDAGAQVAC